MLYLICRKHVSQERSAYGFLLPAEAVQSAKTGNGKMLDLPRLLLFAAAFFICVHIGLRWCQPQALHIYFERPALLHRLSPTIQENWLRRLKEIVRDKGFRLIHLHWQGGDLQLDREDLQLPQIPDVDLNFSLLPMPTSAPTESLLCGPTARGQLYDRVPYPLPKERAVISRVEKLASHQALATVLRLDTAPRLPLSLHLEEHSLAGSKLLLSRNQVPFIFTSNENRLQLNPSDDQSWNDQAVWDVPKTLDAPLWYVTHDSDQSITQWPTLKKGYWNTPRISITLASHISTAAPDWDWAFAPKSVDNLELPPLPSDSPMQVTTLASLPQAVHHLLVDLPLKSLPDHYLPTHLGEPILMIEQMCVGIKINDRLITTLRPEYFANIASQQSFLMLGLGKLGAIELDRLPLLYQYDVAEDTEIHLSPANPQTAYAGWGVPTQLAMLLISLILCLAGIQSREYAN